MNEQLSKADEFAGWFKAFIVNYPEVTAIAVAILCSWLLTLAVKPFVPPGNWKARGLRAFDICVAFCICARMWPGEHRFVWALLIGASSPVVYWIVTGLVGWKWPAARRFFTLKELASDSVGEDASSDVDPPVPPTSNT